MKNLLCLAGVLLFTMTTYAQNCNLNDEAQRYMARANAAVDAAKNNEDYLIAVEEFKKALQLAPNCPDIYYNIAMCYDKSCGSVFFKGIKGYAEAIENYKKYLVLAPYASDKQAIQNRIYELEYKTENSNPAEPDMVFVSGGTFLMGNTSEQSTDDIFGSTKQHEVTLSSFYIGKYEVTQGQWRAIMGNNPSKFKGDNLPVENVSWNDVQTFIVRLNKVTSKQYRLPTEAEWEYAARGGNKTNFYRYSGSNNADDVGWYKENSGKKTHPVGTKFPNELGIYDMSGNVCEWCNDGYEFYETNAQTNPHQPVKSTVVIRGGNCKRNEKNLRVSFRDFGNQINNVLGLRLAHNAE